jgi:hypothetical protein
MDWKHRRTVWGSYLKKHCRAVFSQIIRAILFHKPIPMRSGLFIGYPIRTQN